MTTEFKNFTTRNPRPPHDYRKKPTLYDAEWYGRGGMPSKSSSVTYSTSKSRNHTFEIREKQYLKKVEKKTHLKSVSRKEKQTWLKRWLVYFQWDKLGLRHPYALTIIIKRKQQQQKHTSPSQHMPKTLNLKQDFYRVHPSSQKDGALYLKLLLLTYYKRLLAKVDSNSFNHIHACIFFVKALTLIWG